MRHAAATAGIGYHVDMDGVAYREQSMTCPSCGERLVEEQVFDRPIRRCQRCLGEWADEATLLAFFTARMPPSHPPPARLAFYFIDPLYHNGQPGRRCPICAGPMQQTGLARIAVDRCERDGVWFDRGKLAVALSRPTDVVWPPPPVETIPLAHERSIGSEAVWLVIGIVVIVGLFAVSFAR